MPLQQKPRSILSKYDEELEGERLHSFRLDQGGMADGIRERELEEVRAKLRLQAQSLSTVGPRIASEYLTPEEMVSSAAAAHTMMGAVVPSSARGSGGRPSVRLVLGPCWGAVIGSPGAVLLGGSGCRQSSD